MLSQALDSGRRISGHIVTLFLFTKSDVLTTLLPVTLFALANASHLNAPRILNIIIWIWIHLLKFDISNQIQDPEEDKRNKPDRPLPAGRITTQNAADVRWLLVPVCLIFSAIYGRQTLAYSCCFEALSMWYNEFGGHKAGLSKNLLTAIGYTCLEAGATIIAGSSPCLDSISGRAVALNCAVFATTLHAQDFKDEEGDRFIGRRTLVTLFPTFARVSMVIGVPLWSFFLSRLWSVDLTCSVVFMAYGIVVGGRFMVYRTSSADKQSCKLYSLWFAIAHLLPGYWRFFCST
ncbi:UbiA prenyltransferase family [Suillus spraguei]|nr:UbiA prenyltransferase family [Suillus spraguei]